MAHLWHPSSPTHPDESRGGPLCVRAPGSIIHSHVITQCVTLRPQPQAGVSLPVLLCPGPGQPHPPTLGLANGDQRLEMRKMLKKFIFLAKIEILK